jgi:hypothetical protein
VDGQSEEPDGLAGGSVEPTPAQPAPVRPLGTPPPPGAPQTTQQDRQGAEQSTARYSGQQASTLRWNLSVALAVVVLIAAVVVGVVLLVSGHSSGVDQRAAAFGSNVPESVPSPGTTTTPPPSEGAPGSETTETNSTSQETTSNGETTTGTTSTSDGPLPGVSTEQMQSEIQQMLLTWHEDVVAGNYHGAWELLSQRKQQQNEREYGYATWVKNQSTLRPYLNPSGLRVTVEKTESSDGVAQVDVTGMGWDKPGAPCHEWSGITWVKYEDGSWKYDPGYSTTPQREHEFKSRYPELLGGKC